MLLKGILLIVTSIYLSGCGDSGTEEVSTSEPVTEEVSTSEPVTEESSTFGSAEFGSVKFQ
jgi:hypothetical protein